MPPPRCLVRRATSDERRATSEHYRIKTAGLWEIVLLANRDLVWTSFFGTRLITTVDPIVNENDELLERVCPF